MNGKRLPALLGLALLPAIAFGSAQTAQAATHDPGTSSVADTVSDSMRIPTLDPVDEESQESEESGQQESTTPEEISQEESMRNQSLTDEPMQQQSMRGGSETSITEPRHHWSEQGE